MTRSLSIIVFLTCCSLSFVSANSFFLLQKVRGGDANFNNSNSYLIRKKNPKSNKPLLWKSQEEMAFLEKSLQHGILFHDLAQESPKDLAKKFTKVEYEPGSTIFQEHEEGDFMLLIYKGDCSVSINGKLLPEPYGTMGKGSMLGELALLYGKGR